MSHSRSPSGFTWMIEVQHDEKWETYQQLQETLVVHRSPDGGDTELSSLREPHRITQQPPAWANYRLSAALQRSAFTCRGRRQNKTVCCQTKTTDEELQPQKVFRLQMSSVQPTCSTYNNKQQQSGKFWNQQTFRIFRKLLNACFTFFMMLLIKLID